MFTPRSGHFLGIALVVLAVGAVLSLQPPPQSPMALAAAQPETAQNDAAWAAIVRMNDLFQQHRFLSAGSPRVYPLTPAEDLLTGEVLENNVAIAAALGTVDMKAPISTSITPAPISGCGPIWTSVASPNVPGTNNSLQSVAVVSANDIWAVGYYGMGAPNDYHPLIEHWDGNTWRIVPNDDPGGSFTPLYGVVALASNDVWAVGYSDALNDGVLIEHWDGSSWMRMSVPAVPEPGGLYSVSAAGPNDVWAVGSYFINGGLEQTLVLHWTGGPDWTVVPSANQGTSHNEFLGVTALAPDNVWAVGRHTTDPTSPYTWLTLTEHWDGTSWLVVPSPSPSTSDNLLRAVAGTGPHDLWATGYYYDAQGVNQALVLHGDGSSWSVVPTPPAWDFFFGLAAFGANDVWAVGGVTAHWDGNTWTQVSGPVNDWNGMVSLGTTNIWAVGGNTQTAVEHYSAPCLTPSVTPTNTPTATPNASATATCGLAWRDVGGPDLGPGNNSLSAVAAAGANDVWAVGVYSTGLTLAEHWNGAGWSQVPSPNGALPFSQFNGVTAISSNDVWAVGNTRSGTQIATLTAHWDGSAWTLVPSPNVGTVLSNLLAVTAVGPNDVWAVGYYETNNVYTLIEHWDGTAWTVVPSPSTGVGANRLYATAARAADDVWAVGLYTGNSGAQTLVEHWNGSAWSIVPTPVVSQWDNRFYGVQALSANDAWAVGYYSDGTNQHTLTEHWDGTAWTRVPSPDLAGFSQFNALSADSATSLWAVGFGQQGGQTLVAHWDGSTWSIVPSPSSGLGTAFTGVVALTWYDVWAVGSTTDQAGQHALIAHYADPCGTPGPTATPTAPPPTVTATAPPPTATAALPAATTTPPPATGTACAVQFSDVHPSDYFYEPVQYLACHGVISGYADGTFRPYANTTRSQMVKIVVLGFGLPSSTPAGGAHTFADVPPAFPFFSVIETAAGRGVVSGYSCGGTGEPCDDLHRPYFRPYAEVTRGQLSKIDVGAAGWPLVQPPSGTFADVAPGSPFYPFVETAYCRGIISGYTCGGPGEPCDEQHRPYFRQGNNATRGQIAKIVYLSITGSGACAPP